MIKLLVPLSVLGDELDTEVFGKIEKPLEKFGDFSKSLTSANAPFIQ